jgi:hypothetical protein
MSRRGSNFRSKLKERLRPVVAFGLAFRNPAESSADRKYNKRLAKRLRSDTFHCRVGALFPLSLALTIPKQDLEPDTNQYEHPVFIRCIAEAFFWDSTAIGVVFHQKFRHVPLPAVALVLTTVCVLLYSARLSLTNSFPDAVLHRGVEVGSVSAD